MSIDQFCKDNVVQRKGTGSLKWDRLEEIFGSDDLTPFWLADMEFKTPSGVRDAVGKLNEHGVYGYAIPKESYYEALIDWQKKHHNMTLSKENVRFYTGVVGGLYAVINALTQKDDSVIICAPVYYPFYDIVLNSGRKLVTTELVNTNGEYTIDYADFEAKVAESEVKALILCSPHNPVGRVWSEEELDKLFAICQKHGVLIVSDEIHQDFTYTKKFIPASEVSGGKYRDLVITMHAASKTFNLAGLIHSHTFIFNADLMEKYDGYVKTIGSAEGNIMGLLAVEAAYRTGEEWLENLKAVIVSNYDYLKSTFAKEASKITVTPLEGTYLTWIDLRGYMDAKEVADFAIKDCKLAVDVGEWFSFTGHGFIRINLATDPKFVKNAVSSILENLKK